MRHVLTACHVGLVHQSERWKTARGKLHVLYFKKALQWSLCGSETVVGRKECGWNWRDATVNLDSLDKMGCTWFHQANVRGKENHVQIILSELFKPCLQLHYNYCELILATSVSLHTNVTANTLNIMYVRKTPPFLEV